MSDFAPYTTDKVSFIIKNTTTDRNKTISVFGCSILYNQTKDLMSLPGISESDIRDSLLKGELRNKLLYGDITIVFSNVELIQFSESQKTFLSTKGLTNGLSANFDSIINVPIHNYVNNLSELEALSVVDFDDNILVYVASVSDFYQLDKTSNLISDNIAVLTASEGKWVRKLIRHKKWSYQSNWYIDSIYGNDENDGYTSVTAIKTWKEFQLRVSYLATNMNVYILNNMSEILKGNFEGYNGSWTLNIIGVPTILETLINTTFTDPVRSGVQAPGTMSSSNVSNFTPYDGKFLRANNTKWAPILGISGGTNPVLPYWTDNSFNTTKPTNGTSIEILSLPEVESIIITVTSIKLIVSYLKFTTTNAFEAPYIIGSYFGRFICCDFACTFFNASDTYYFSCMLSGSGSFIPFLTARFICGGSRRAIFHGNVGVAQFTGFIIYGASGVGLEFGNQNNSSIISQIDTTGTSLGIGIFNSSGTGIKLGQGAKLSAQSLFGSGNGGYGFEINYGADAWFASTPSITGTLGDLQFCGSSTAIPPLTAGASVPAAATLTTWSNFTSSPFNSRVMHYGNGTKMAGS